MTWIAIAGLVAGAVAGLMGSIATRTEEDAADQAQIDTDRSESEEIETQIDAATDIFAAQQAEIQAQLDFEVGEQRIAQDRAVGAQVAANAASGLGGASKVAVAEQLSADFDRAIEEMERAAQAEMAIDKMEFDEDIRQQQRDADILALEADEMEEDLDRGYFEASRDSEGRRIWGSSDFWSDLTGIFGGMA